MRQEKIVFIFQNAIFLILKINNKKKWKIGTKVQKTASLSGKSLRQFLNLPDATCHKLTQKYMFTVYFSQFYHNCNRFVICFKKVTIVRNLRIYVYSVKYLTVCSHLNINAKATKMTKREEHEAFTLPHAQSLH